MNNKKRFLIWFTVIALIFIIFLVTIIIEGVEYNEAIAYTIILLAIGCIYEIWQWLKTHNKMYRIAFRIGFLGTLLVFWVNGAVGIIGSENNPANYLYVGIFITAFIGSIVSRLKPKGMAITMFLTALVQALVPLYALFIWPAKASWGDAGVIGVLFFNSIFACIFITSGFFFKKAGSDKRSN